MMDKRAQESSNPIGISVAVLIALVVAVIVILTIIRPIGKGGEAAQQCETANLKCVPEDQCDSKAALSCADKTRVCCQAIKEEYKEYLQAQTAAKSGAGTENPEKLSEEAKMQLYEDIKIKTDSRDFSSACGELSDFVDIYRDGKDNNERLIKEMACSLLQISISPPIEDQFASCGIALKKIREYTSQGYGSISRETCAPSQQPISNA